MDYKLKFDNELKTFLRECSGLSTIVDIINYSRGAYLNTNGDFIKYEEGDIVSFIPKSKISQPHLGFDEIKNRTKIRIGRFVGKFVQRDKMEMHGVRDRDIEIFVNLFKSFFDNNEKNIKVVEGEDILKYYHEENYFKINGYEIGNLWKSCMRNSHKNKYMRIYSYNTDKIKMLVKLDDSGLVKTRALLWEDCEDSNGVKYKVMDRIYSVHDHDIIFFKKWAIDNGYIHKAEQSSTSEVNFVNEKGRINLNLIVKLPNHIFEYYPYIDTFKFYSNVNGTLANSEIFRHSFTLVQGDGNLEREHDEDLVHDDMDDDY